MTLLDLRVPALFPAFSQRSRRPVAAASALCLALVAAFALPALATQLVVNTASDASSGVATNCTPQASATSNTTDLSCGLRDALTYAAASAAPSIDIGFDSTAFASAQTILLNSELPTIVNNVAITGPGVNQLTISGQTVYPIFFINDTVASGTVSISGLTMANGNALSLAGGAMFVVNGSISLSNCALSNNIAPTSGAIEWESNSPATLTASNCTFTGNSATTNRGGVSQSTDRWTVTGCTFINNSSPLGGALVASGTATITNSTFINNSVSTGGAGGAIVDLGNLTISDSTFSGNSASFGGAIIVANTGSTLTMNNNIFTGNTASGVGAAIYNDVPTNSITNADFNVYWNNLTNGSEDDCNSCTTNNDATSAASNPLLPQGNYGGPTQTMLPAPGGGAICAGSAALLPSGTITDQRGDARTTTYSTPSVTCVDAGAVQSNYSVSFSTEPPVLVGIATAFSPAPTVDLTESGKLITAGAAPIAMSDIDSALGGTTTENTAAGYAAFNNLTVGSVVSGDTLTATLTLATAGQPITVTATSSSFSTPQLQTITFPAIAEPVYVGGTITLSATASSGLAVSYVSVYSAQGVCSVTNTGGVWTVNLLAVGSCSIEALQWGNKDYAPAKAFQNFYIHSNTQTISFPAVSVPVYAGSSVSLSATATSGLAVSFSTTTPTICAVTNILGSWSAVLTAGGRCTIEAKQSGGASRGKVYAPAPAVSQTFSVSRLTQTITFPAIVEPVFVGGTVTPAATAGSGLPVSYVSVHPTICTVTNSGGVWTINLIAVGECSVEAQQGGSTTYYGAAFAFQNFYVHPAH